MRVKSIWWTPAISPKSSNVFGHTPVGLSFLIEPDSGFCVLSRFEGASTTKSAHETISGAKKFAQAKYEEALASCYEEDDGN